MEYCITVSRTQTTAIWFDADNDDEAREKAEGLYDDVDDADFDGGSDYDYALDSADGRCLVSWN